MFQFSNTCYQKCIYRRTGDLRPKTAVITIEKPRRKKMPKKPAATKHSCSRITKRPQGGIGRGILEIVPPTQPIYGWGWDREFHRLVEFRRGNPGKWPSRDSSDPSEAWLADWFRSNLELYWARRLSGGQTYMIMNLVEGRYDKTKKKSRSGTGKRAQM